MADGRRPRVLVDATAIPADRGGVGRYVDSLVQAADRSGLVIACQESDAAHFRLVASRSEVLPQRGISHTARRLIWEQTVLPRLARKHGIDVIHSPHYTMPVMFPGARVVVFHDMTFFSDPTLHNPLKATFFRFWVRWSARRADRVICVSAATRSELLRVCTVRRTPDVVHLGVDARRFRPPDEIEADRLGRRLGTTRWLAFLGTLEPRKNVPALIRAVRDARAGGVDLPVLLLAGGDGWDHEVPRELSLTPESVARRVGYLPLEDLPTFLGAAEIVAYPSLGEGFGLPVLEAMATGGVVLTTRRLSLPEVGGDAVAYCDVDAESIRDALEDLARSPVKRTRLRERARARAEGFTWSATAELTETIWAEARR